MKKKQFMSKLAALTMAAAMGVTALPATVMAAGVKDVTAKNDTAANAAATGLVQTTLPSTVTGGEAAKEALYTAYKAYDDVVEGQVKALGAKSTALEVQGALKSGSIVPEGDVTIIPATGNTTATAGSTTVQIKLPYTYGGITTTTPASVSITTGTGLTVDATKAPTAAAGTYKYSSSDSKWKKDGTATDATLTDLGLTGTPANNDEVIVTAASSTTTGATTGSQLLTLNVKWGTDAQDALSEAYDLVEKDIRTESTTTTTAYYKLHNITLTNAKTGDFSEDSVKKAFGSGLTISGSDFKTVSGYTATATIEGASNYVAPTATTDGSYDIKVKTSVSQTANPKDSADRTDTFKVVIKKLGNAVITGVTADSTNSSTTALSAFGSGNITKADTAYDINVSVAGTGIDSTKTETNGLLKKSEVAKANLTFTSSDTSIAEIVESSTSNTGYALKFKKPGKVKISYTCPNFKDANSTSATAIASKTANLQASGSDVEVELKNTPVALESVVDGLDKTVNQADAADDKAAVTAAKTRVTEAVKAYYGRDDITVDVKNVSDFIAATSGTAEDKDGTDGSFYATVTVTDNSNTTATVSKIYKFTIKATAYTAKFTDVSDTSFCAKAVAWAVDNGITTGTTATTFSPDAPVTRAQFVTFLYRQAGSPDVAVNTKFTDIADQPEVFQKAISWAAANGITMGTTDPTKFAPGTTVTRAQAVTFLFRYAKGEATTKTNSFPDVSEDAFCADAVNWGVENGVIKGYDDGRFGTNDPTTRGQAITFIYRALAD